MSKTVHILMGGPIRPTLGYVAKCINSIKKALHNFHVVTHLVTWTTNLNSESIEILNCIFDHTYYCAEPTEKEIASKDIRTVQMRTGYFDSIKARQMFASGYYKLYLSYRQLVNLATIPDNDIVVRIRTDLHINPEGFEVIDNTIKHCDKNTLYIRPNQSCGNKSDWFSISDYTTFKKTYYIPNDEEFKHISDCVFNSEEVIIYKANENGVTVQHIDPVAVVMCICRAFKDGIETLHSYG